MRVTRTASAAFTAEFESEEELRAEYATNLSFGALALPTEETAPVDATLLVTLRGPEGGEAFVKAKVVAALPGRIALAIEGDADELLKRLLPAPKPEEPKTEESQKQNAWDRLRSLTQMEKILLAVKADRSERALMLQDNDPRVLLSLLRNPRLTVDEVARVAKSSFLNYQVAEVILKTTQWMASIDVRLALIRNPKTPPQFGLQILPSLPESEIRAIAKAGTSMALKQAALRRLQGKV